MMKWRHHLTYLGILLGLQLPSGLFAVTVTGVDVDYRDAASLVRLSEYFSESGEGRAVVRTDPEVRSGLYFILELDSPHRDLPEGMMVELSLIVPKSPEPVVQTLAFPKEKGNQRRAFLGLTGEAWPADPDRPQPTAWRVRLLDEAGQLLSEKSSFLWGNR